MPECINSTVVLDWTPYIAPDDSYLIFSSHREGEFGDGDLYISFHDRSADTWSEPINMGEPINTRVQERFPAVSPDGKYLFFTRYNPPHSQDIFWVSAEVIDDIKKNPTVVSLFPNQFTFVDKEFTLKFPSNTFWDFKDTTFNYSARLQNGDPLPGWLTFNPETRTFSGTPSTEQVLNISLTAKDSDMNTGSGNFQIAVVKDQTVDANQVDLEKDLVAKYTFDGNAKDKSSHHYHGKVHGAVLCKDRNGKKNSAYLFDGKNDFML